MTLTSVTLAPDAPGNVIEWGYWRRAVQPENTFASTWYTGDPSGPMTVTFGPTVEQVTVRIYNSSFAGNTMQAYNGQGSPIAEKEFGVTGDDTFFGLWEEQTISASGIAMVELVVADGATGPDNVQYELWFVRDLPPEIACDTVTRGQTTTCQISGPVDAVTGWQFRGTIQGALPWQDSVSVSRSVTSPTWSGIAVLSGTVSAFVVKGGVPDTLTGPLVVTDRSGEEWGWDETDWTYQGGGTVLCAYDEYVMPAPADVRLAVNRRTSECAGGSIDPDVIVDGESGITAALVQGGPNDSLWYATAAHYFMARTSEMNPFITPQGSVDTLTDRTDQRECRRALGLGEDDPVVVNFYTYNNVCKGFSLTPMFDGISAHEGFGTEDQHDVSVANGHEARRRIAAGDPDNDPYRLVERYVNTSYEFLVAAIQDGVYDLDVIISGFASDHTYVKDNYVEGHKCGQAYVFDPNDSRYKKRQVTQNVNGASECI